MHHDSKDEFFGNGDGAYRRLAELLQDAVVLQSGGKIVYTNISGARLLGATSPGDIVGRPVLDFVHSDYRELVKERIELLEEKESVGPVEQKWVRLDGRAIEVEAMADPTIYMGRSATQFVLGDSMESKQVVGHVQKSETRTKAILDASPDLVFVVDGAGKFLDYYASDTDQLYVSREQIIGNKLEDVMPVDIAAEASRSIKTALDSGEAQTFGYQLCLSGEPKDFEARITVSGAGEVLIL
ncbi:MAG: PAS domain-containing protein, partial [Rubrobacteraceae bacterium]